MRTSGSAYRSDEKYIDPSDLVKSNKPASRPNASNHRTPLPYNSQAPYTHGDQAPTQSLYPHGSQASTQSLYPHDSQTPTQSPYDPNYLAPQNYTGQSLPESPYPLGSQTPSQSPYDPNYLAPQNYAGQALSESPYAYDGQPGADPNPPSARNASQGHPSGMHSDDDPNKRYYHDIICDDCNQFIERVYSDTPIDLADPIADFDEGIRLFTKFRDIKTWKLLTIIYPGKNDVYRRCAWHE